MNLYRQLPNALTLSNLLLGTIAVFLLHKVEFDIILYLIAGCLLADILDGSLARRMGVSGELGIHLDSLADVISFGLLPAYMVYILPGDLPALIDKHVWRILFPALIAVSAGLRLARFNIDTRPREYFWGLPTPAGGVMVTGLAWAVFSSEVDPNRYLEWLNIAVYAVPVFLAVMYQVPLKLPGLKSPKPGLYTLVIVGVLTLVGFFIIGPLSIFLGIVLYVVLGLVNLVVKWY